MGVSKTEIFENYQQFIANYARAIAHPARVAILEHVINAKACICIDLTQEIGLAQSTISQHLKVLKETGLIKGNIEGNTMNYCIDKKIWKQMKTALTIFLKKDIKNLSKCC